MADALPDYFSLFHLESQFEIDVAELTRRYHAIQNEIHPDRYAGKPVHEQRLAAQQTAYVNEAYRCLKQPLQRAGYLLALRQPGVAEGQPTLDTAFLMEQMELRERVEALSGNKNAVADLETFCDVIDAKKKQWQQVFLRQLNAQHLEVATTALAKWQFMEKLQQEAHAALEPGD